MKTHTYTRFRATHRRRRHGKTRNYNPHFDFTIYPNRYERTDLDVQVKAQTVLHHIYDTTSTFLVIEVSTVRRQRVQGHKVLACFRRTRPDYPWQFLGLTTTLNPERKTTFFSYDDAVAIKKAAKHLAKMTTTLDRVVVPVHTGYSSFDELIFKRIPNRWGRGYRWSFDFKRSPDNWFLRQRMQAGIIPPDTNTLYVGNL